MRAKLAHPGQRGKYAKEDFVVVYLGRNELVCRWCLGWAPIPVQGEKAAVDKVVHEEHCALDRAAAIASGKFKPPYNRQKILSIVYSKYTRGYRG